MGGREGRRVGGRGGGREGGREREGRRKGERDKEKASRSKEAGEERVEEGGRCVRREREPKCEAGGVRGGRGGAVKGAEARRRLKRCVTQG